MKLRLLPILAWLLLISSTCLLYFKIALDSDLLFLEELYRDLFIYHASWKDWAFTPAPAYFPDVLLYFLYGAFVENPVDRIFLGTISHAVILALCGMWLVRSATSKLAKTTDILVLSCVTLISLSASRTGMWMYFNTTNSHIGTLMLGLLGLGCLIKCVCPLNENRGTQIKYLILLSLIVIAGIICDSLFLVSFWVTSIIFSLIGYAGAKKQIIKNIPSFRFTLTALSLGSGFILAKLIEPFITYNRAFSHYDVLGVNKTITASIEFINSTLNIFLRKEFTFYLLIILILTGFILAIIAIKNNFHLIGKVKNIKENSVKSTYLTPFLILSIFLIILAPLNVLAVIISGLFFDTIGYRYLMLPIALAIILVILQMNHFFVIGHEQGEKRIWQKGVPLAVILSLFLLTGWQWYKQISLISQLNTIRTIGTTSSEKLSSIMLVKCLDEYASNSPYKLKDGVAMYWDARPTKLFSSQGIRINPFYPNGTPHFWMGSKKHFYQINNKDLEYNFVVLHKTPLAIPFTLDTIGKVLPKPEVILECKALPNYQIWFYKDKTLDRTIKSKINIAFFGTNNMVQKINYQASEMPQNTGKNTKEGLRIATPLDKPGYLIYGPYIKIPKGKYRITIKYNYKDLPLKNFSDSTLSYWELGNFSKMKNKLIQKELLLPNTNIIQSEVSLTKSLYNSEIRIFFNGKGTLTISEISVEKI